MIYPTDIILLLSLAVIVSIFAFFIYIIRTARPLDIPIVVASFCIIISVVFFLYATQVETHTINIKHTNINLNDLDKPIKIAFISDIHVGVTDPDVIRAAVEAINAENPDIILLGGDFVDSNENEIAQLSILENLSAKNGVYAVLGNHDYLMYTNSGCPSERGNALAENISAKLEAMGFIVLRDESIPISNSIVLVGLEDYWSCKSDYLSASKSVGNYKTNILLTHNQDAVPKDQLTEWDLVLFGHTHCGQVRLPILGSVPKFLGFHGEYDMGHYELDNHSHLYATCGLMGVARFLAFPEVSIIEIS